MVRIELDDREIEMLDQILEGALSELRMEIADTDQLDFRERLKHRKQVLQKVLTALRQPVLA